LNKDFVMGAILATVAALAIFSSTAVTPSTNTFTVTSAVCVYKNGVLLDNECTHNTMMNTGLNWTRDLIGNANGGGAIKNIVLGNTSTAELNSLISLPGQINDCNLTSAAGTFAIVGTGNYSTTYQWTSTCNDHVVNTTALYNVSAPGASCTVDNCTMFAGKNFTSPVTLMANDMLNVTWYVWVQ